MSCLLIGGSAGGFRVYLYPLKCRVCSHESVRMARGRVIAICNWFMAAAGLAILAFVWVHMFEAPPQSASINVNAPEEQKPAAPVKSGSNAEMRPTVPSAQPINDQSLDHRTVSGDNPALTTRPESPATGYRADETVPAQTAAPPGLRVPAGEAVSYAPAVAIPPLIPTPGFENEANQNTFPLPATRTPATRPPAKKR